MFARLKQYDPVCYRFASVVYFIVIHTTKECHLLGIMWTTEEFQINSNLPLDDRHFAKKLFVYQVNLKSVDNTLCRGELLIKHHEFL